MVAATCTTLNSGGTIAVPPGGELTFSGCTITGSVTKITFDPTGGGTLTLSSLGWTGGSLLLESATAAGLSNARIEIIDATFHEMSAVGVITSAATVSSVAINLTRVTVTACSGNAFAITGSFVAIQQVAFHVTGCNINAGVSSSLNDVVSAVAVFSGSVAALQISDFTLYLIDTNVTVNGLDELAAGSIAMRRSSAAGLTLLHTTLRLTGSSVSCKGKRYIFCGSFVSAGSGSSSVSLTNSGIHLVDSTVQATATCCDVYASSIGSRGAVLSGNSASIITDNFEFSVVGSSITASGLSSPIAALAVAAHGYYQNGLATISLSKVRFSICSSVIDSTEAAVDALAQRKHDDATSTFILAGTISGSNVTVNVIETIVRTAAVAPRGNCFSMLKTSGFLMPSIPSAVRTTKLQCTGTIGYTTPAAPANSIFITSLTNKVGAAIAPASGFAGAIVSSAGGPHSPFPNRCPFAPPSVKTDSTSVSTSATISRTVAVSQSVLGTLTQTISDSRPQSSHRPSTLAPPPSVASSSAPATTAAQLASQAPATSTPHPSVLVTTGAPGHAATGRPQTPQSSTSSRNAANDLSTGATTSRVTLPATALTESADWIVLPTTESPPPSEEPTDSSVTTANRTRRFPLESWFGNESTFVGAASMVSLATGFSAPATPSRMGRVRVLLRNLNCELEEEDNADDERPPWRELPLQFALGGGDLRWLLGASVAATAVFIVLPASAHRGVWVGATRSVAFCQPKVLKVAAALMSTLTQYFSPTCVGAATKLIVFGSKDERSIAVLLLAAVLVITAISVRDIISDGHFGARTATKAGGGEPEFINKSPSSFFVEAMHPLFDAAKRVEDKLLRCYCVEEQTVSLALAVLDGAEIKNCPLVTGAATAITLAHLFYLIAVRPYAAQFDFGFAVVSAAAQATVATLLLLVFTVTVPDWVYVAIDVASFCACAIFFVQFIATMALEAQAKLCGNRRKVAEEVTDEEDAIKETAEKRSKLAVPLLIADVTPGQPPPPPPPPQLPPQLFLPTPLPRSTAPRAFNQNPLVGP